MQYMNEEIEMIPTRTNPRWDRDELIGENDRLFAKSQDEDRDLTAEEARRIDTNLEKVRSLNDKIEAEKTKKSFVSPTGPFRNLGEQLQAVVTSAFKIEKTIN